jgi:transcription antitermination factor NusG
MGISAAVPLRVDVIRRGKRRFADAVISPALPNYVFITCSDYDWHRLHSVKALSATMLQVPSSSEASIRRFMADASAAYAERMQMIEAGQRVEEYEPGQALQLAAGPFAGQIASFRRVVESASSLWPEIEAETEAFGRMVKVRVDPLSVRKAE